MASDEENNLDELLGRVSDKLGWQHIKTNDDITASRKPSETVHGKNKKSVRSSSKRVPSNWRKDNSFSSDKENSITGCRQHNNAASKHSKAEIDCRGQMELQTSPCNVLTEKNDIDKNDEVITLCSKRISKSCVAAKPIGSGCRKDFDVNSSVSEAFITAEDPSAQGDCLSASLLKEDENVSDFLTSQVCEKSSLLSSDEDDLARNGRHSSVPNLDGVEESFSPLQPYSETAQPMTWLLTPPPKENLFKASANLVEKINTVVISDSESDSSFDSYDLNHKCNEVSSPSSDSELDSPFGSCVLDHNSHEISSSSTKTDFETHECLDPVTPDLSRDPLHVAKSTGVTTVTSSDSDSQEDPICHRQVLSLTERLSKNFQLRKGKPVSSHKKGHSGRLAGLTKGKKATDDNARTLQTPRAPLYSSSDDDDNDFEQFLQAIKTPQSKAPSSRTTNPTADKDQKENSFIDDTPIDDENSEDDVYYYRHINSDQKSFLDKKPQTDRETKTSSTPWKYRLPQFSNSDDDDDSVFATPKPPAVKKITPSVLSTSKKFRTPILQKRDTPTTVGPTDFMSSLATPKHGCSSSSPYVTDFKKHRAVLTQKLFGIFNKTVFDNKLPLDFSIKWNNRMRKTAGYCYYTKTKLTGQCSARIELSDKVCDTAERLRDTLVHELCHAACWLINRVNDGHGRFWKYWAAKANHAHPSIPIIKRCHSYEITTKYKYQCVTCKATIGRHSKSINTAKFCCAYCKGNLVLLPSVNKDGKMSKPRTPNKFAMFVKENYGSVKKDNASMKHADIMRLLSQDFSKKAIVSV